MTQIVNVVNTVTGKHAGSFCDTEEDAVIAAYAQNMFKDFNPKHYWHKYRHLLKRNGNTISCGPFAVA